MQEKVKGKKIVEKSQNQDKDKRKKTVDKDLVHD